MFERPHLMSHGRLARAWATWHGRDASSLHTSWICSTQP